MWAFLLKRLAGGAFTLFVIASLCFVIVRFAPGSPFTSDRKLPPEVLRNRERKYHLDKPLPVQFVMRMKGYLRGDFGLSTQYDDRPVMDYIGPALPTSMQLGCLAFLFAMALGISTGIVAAGRQNRWPDHLSMSVAVGGICVPNFLLGPLLVMLFALTLQWLPVAGWPESWSPAELSKLVLPAVTLAMVHVAYISRLMRAGMLDVMNKDYIRTARAKGLSERAVFLKHGLKNGVTPVVSYAGPMAAHIFTGSVVVEKVFNIPGLGRHFVDSALSRDYDLFLGSMLVYSALIIAFNIAVDVAYSLLDPRVRLG